MKTLFTMTLPLLLAGSMIFAGKQEDLEKFKQTGICMACDLSGFRLTEIINQLQKDEKPIDLFDSNLQGSNLDKANLEKASLCYVNLSRASAKKTNFARARLPNAILNEIHAPSAKFFEANLDNTQLKKANLQDAEFNGTSGLSNANFKDANISDAKFIGLSLAEANLKRAKAHYALFNYVLLKGAKMSNFSAIGATFSGDVDMSEADLTDAEFEQCTFENVKFDNANVKRACFALNNKISWTALDKALHSNTVRYSKYRKSLWEKIVDKFK
jgi:uncharacterized protein YjbI with pentapeptide repeats